MLQKRAYNGLNEGPNKICSPPRIPAKLYIKLILNHLVPFLELLLRNKHCVSAEIYRYVVINRHNLHILVICFVLQYDAQTRHSNVLYGMNNELTYCRLIVNFNLTIVENIIC